MAVDRALPPVFAEPLAERTDEPGGGFILRSPVPLRPFAARVTDWLDRWARDTPDAVFLEERDPPGTLRATTFAATSARVRSLAQGLLDLGASRARPVLVLSDNGIDHAELTLAAMLVGVPAAPVSPAYSLLSGDFAKLTEIARTVGPAVVFADDGARFERALRHLASALDDPFAVVVSRGPVSIAARGSTTELCDSRFVRDLANTPPTSAVDAAHARVDGDTIAKILFTSGSTGRPKGVVNTHRMLCSNQEAIAQIWPFVETSPPVVVDWLPWSHTFGANHNFNMVLRNGGTLAIDAGKPTPERIGITAQNLREVSPTLYFNVPRGFDMLLPLLETDGDLRERFFRRLQLVFYAAAALPQPLWERLEKVSTLALGRPVTMVSAWGSTETSPLMTSVHFPIPRAGVIGLPIPGSTLRFVPHGTKLEMRVAGPNVTPGYWDRATIQPTTLDSEGFLSTGDAGRLEDPRAPEKGVVFDGRIAENFKLMSGTWVSVGELRLKLVAALAPLVQDVVIAGHDRESLSVLLFANEAACRKLVPNAASATLAEIVASEAVREGVTEGLRHHNREHPASSTCIVRAALLTEPPSIDAGEITDKGYVNQSAVLACRANVVDMLFADEVGPRCIDVRGGAWVL